MNINCIICSDLFLPTSDIYVTKCGHVFHYMCLIQWIERSKTCPQCRSKTTEKCIYRIYFNILTSEGIAEDATTLQNKVDTLNLQLRLNENFVKTTEEEIKVVTIEKAALELKLSDMKLEVDKFKSGNTSLKEQVRFYKEQAKFIEQTQSENKLLKDKLRAMELESTTLTGTLEEAQDVINSCESAQTLSLIAKSLKKELVTMEKKRNFVLKSLRRAENTAHASRKECKQFQEEIENLKLQLLSHKQCEAEMQNLKKEIAKLMENNSFVNPSLTRVVTESPAPMLTKIKQTKTVCDDVSFEQVNSPSVSLRVKDIKESESPYLKVKSNCLAMFLNSDGTTRFGGSSSTSIFKKASSSSDIKSLPKKSIPEGNYNGFGGHNKEDRYPTPKLTGLKRSKSSTLSSLKFRKIDKTNSKLDDFLISELE